MKDPPQMVEQGSGFTEAERELVAAGREVTMPPGERARLWASVAAACVATEAGVAAAAGAASASASAGTTSGSVLSALASWKGVTLLAVLGGGVAAYHMSRPRPAEPRPIPAPAVRHASVATAVSRAEPGPMPAAVEPQPAAAPEKPAAPAPSRAPGARAARSAVVSEPADETARTAPSRLAEESRAVIAARRALRDGDPALSLRLLDAARAAFPDGSLSQEREALTIQALASSGQRELAARRAASFLREHPESPHAADLKHIAH
jgi:hypothetical protein